MNRVGNFARLMSSVCAQVVHRDIAVRNFLVDIDGRVMLCDFGLTKFLPDGMDYIGAWLLMALSGRNDKVGFKTKSML